MWEFDSLVPSHFSCICPGHYRLPAPPSPGPLTVSYRYHNATESAEAVTGWNVTTIDYADDVAGRMTTATLLSSTCLGSTMAVVDASGTVQDSYTYDVYGTPSKTGSLANEFDFAGQQTDGTGLQYLRARYYDPATGTFLSREPLTRRPAWLGNPTGYGAGNPARFKAPAGTKPCDEDNYCWSAQIPPANIPPSGSGPDFPDGNVYSPPPSVYAACDGLYYYLEQKCRDLLPFGGDWTQPLREYAAKGLDFAACNSPASDQFTCGYHHALKACASDSKCRAAIDNALTLGTASDQIGDILNSLAFLGGGGSTVGLWAAKYGTAGFVYGAFSLEWTTYKFAYGGGN